MMQLRLGHQRHHALSVPRPAARERRFVAPGTPHRWACIGAASPFSKQSNVDKWTAARFRWHGSVATESADAAAATAQFVRRGDGRRDERHLRLRTGLKYPWSRLPVEWRWLHGGGTARRTPPPSRNQSPEPCARASQPYLRKSLRKGREQSIRPVRAKCVRWGSWVPS